MFRKARHLAPQIFCVGFARNTFLQTIHLRSTLGALLGPSLRNRFMRSLYFSRHFGLQRSIVSADTPNLRVSFEVGIPKAFNRLTLASCSLVNFFGRTIKRFLYMGYDLVH